MEDKADFSSYGFRPARSCHDALERILLILSSSNIGSLEPKKPWVVEGEIKGCFDNIDHDYLMKKIGDFPASPLVLRWLKAGFVDSDGFHDTDLGTPQGCIISPLLSNITLDGLEADLGITYRKRKTKTYPYYRYTVND